MDNPCSVLQDNIYVLNATCDKAANEGSFTCMIEGKVSDQTLTSSSA